MMTATYLDDLLYQPAALQATIDSLSKARPLTQLRKALKAGDYQHVILTGMGSSFHALYPLQLRLLTAEINAIRLETSELIHYAPKLINPSSLIVVVSQSGQSAEVVRLLELTQGDVTLVGVTNTPRSTLAEQASQVILTCAGEEASVSCKTYITALAALAWLGDQLVDSQAQFPDLWGLPEMVAEYWSGWKESVELLHNRLMDMQQLFLLGRGDSLASACTGALIIKEAARIAAEGMSSASFRHGPLELITPFTFTLIYLGRGHTSPLNIRLADEIRSAGSQVEMVGLEESNPPFKLPSCSPAALPIVEILPAQLLSLALAELQGIQPGRFKHSQKVTVAE